MEEENMTMNAEAEDIICGEDIPEDSTEKLGALEAENALLRRKLLILSSGIPEDAEEYICAAAEKHVTDSISFEEAVNAEADRFMKLFGTQKRTTGVRISDRENDSDAALRRAFGIR